MTVNERMFVSGELDRFESGVRDGEEGAARNILAGLDRSADDIHAILRQRGP